jgi:PAS domain S-box-containing protein
MTFRQGTHAAPHHADEAQDTDFRLLDIGFRQMRFNLLLTAASFSLGVAILWSRLPGADMPVWLANILLMVGIGLIIDAAYRRRAPGRQGFRFWKAAFTFNVWHAGGAWGLGPVLMLVQANDAQILLLAVMVLASCAVVVNSVAEQRAAMFGFVTLALLPPAAVAGLSDRGDLHALAIVLVLGHVAFIVTGANSHRTLRALVESKARLHAVLDNSLDAILGVDDRGRISAWNRRAESVFGWQRHEALGLAVEEALVPPRHRQDYREKLERFIGGQAPELLSQRIELAARRRNGEEFPIELVAVPIRVGKSWHYTGFITDISERKANEHALVSARESAERASRAKSDFLSSMSHELRTPMNAILGFAQILEMDARLEVDQREFVNEILQGGNHLLALINEVLEMSRIESGKIQLSIEVLDLADLVHQCRTLIQPLADARGVSLHFDLPAPTRVCGDRVRLKQSLLNLLSNAVKYNREHGEIRLGVETIAGDRLRITVSDTGTGIPAERMAELFQPFSRLGAEQGTVEGTGIGLSITRRLIEMMGGKVGAFSTPGQGSDFWIELPVAAANRSAILEPPT